MLWRQLRGQARAVRYQVKPLARARSLSPRQFEREFLKVARTTPHAWAGRVRLADTKRFLRQGYPLQEISFLLGFKHLSSFDRWFKSETGKMPGVFLRDAGRCQESREPRGGSNDRRAGFSKDNNRRAGPCNEYIASG